MSIYVYSGTPGTGKSLHMANDCRFQLNRPTPRPVIANWRLADGAPVKHPEMFHYVDNDDLSVDYLIGWADDYWKDHEFQQGGIWLCLDEVQLLFNSRSWSNKDRLKFVGFMSQHRKCGYNIILCAQSVMMIDTQFRQNVEYEVNHRKLSSMGPLGDLVAAPFGGNLFMAVTYLFNNGNHKERLGSRWFVAHRKDMAMYDSYVRFEGVPDL